MTPISRVPTWAEELLEVFELRRNVLYGTAVTASVVGLVAAWLFPSVVPPNALVGASVGAAACLLAVAAAIALDAGDLVVRGPRHIRAAGATVTAVVPPIPSPGVARTILTVIERAGAERLRVALSPASASSGDAAAWTEALAVALAGTGRRVLSLDLASGPSRYGVAGVADVARHDVALAQAVQFDPELSLARLGPGKDQGEALQALESFVGRLPRDIEALVAALPEVSRAGVLAAAAATGRLCLLVRVGATSRVDLLAALDGADANGVGVDVLLLDPAAPMPGAAPATGAVPPPAPAPAEIDLRDEQSEPPAEPHIEPNVPAARPVLAVRPAASPQAVDTAAVVDPGAGHDATDDALRRAVAIDALTQEIWSRDADRGSEERRGQEEHARS